MLGTDPKIMRQCVQILKESLRLSRYESYCIYWFCALFVLALLGTIGFHFYGHDASLLKSLQSYTASWQKHYYTNPLFVASMYVGIYAILKALSVPGMFFVTMIGGSIFGVWLGLGLTIVGSVLGSVTCLIAVRYLFRDYIPYSWKTRIDAWQKEVTKQPFLFVFTLRLVPIIPYYFINMGLAMTSIRIPPFALATGLGMIPIHLLYSHAGLKLAQMSSARDILSFDILMLLCLIATMPILLKRALTYFNHKSVTG